MSWPSFTCLGYQGTYWLIIRLLGVPGWDYPFLDIEGVLTAIDCHRSGIDVYVENPCDPLNRPHNYGPAFLWLSALRINVTWMNGLGLTLGILFLVSLFFLPKARPGWLVTLAIVSPPVVFALERANVDLIIFLLAMLAAILAAGNAWSRTVAHGLAMVMQYCGCFPATGSCTRSEGAN